MLCTKESLLLYAVTDRTWLGSRTLCEVVEEALRGGVTCLQLREKQLDFDAFVTEAKALLPLTQSKQVPLIINDNLEVALAVDADGLHVGQGDCNAKECRRQLGPSKILGVSVQTVAQAIQAQEDGADYLGVGAMFSTSTKEDADLVSHDTLSAICKAVQIPVVAIGGIHEGTVHTLQNSGIAGIAVVSALFAAEDITEATRTMAKLAQEVVE